MGITRDLIENERPTIKSPNTTEDKAIGIRQTWQDMTKLRREGVIYTNDTNKPIKIYLGLTQGIVKEGTLKVEGITTGFTPTVQENITNLYATVPSGQEYILTHDGIIKFWSELRD